MSRALLPSLLLCAGCLWPRAEGGAGSPLDVAAAGAMEAKELSEGPPEQKVYGWRLEIAGGRAQYSVCTAADACTFRRVDVAAESVRATKVVSRARPAREDGTTGDEVDVFELTLRHDVPTSRGGVTTDARGIVIR